MPKRKFDNTIAESMKSAASDNFADNIQMIDIDELRESTDNFFDVTRIDELAEAIYEQGGVMENLVVQPLSNEDGKYEVISGHRRTAAVRKLLESGKRVSRVLPCYVRSYGDEDEKRLDIILMNITSRIISDSEMWKCYEIINEVLQNKKKLGEKFGQVQKKLAEILGVSTGQAAKMQNIDRRATQEVKEALESGDISINTAEKIAKLAEDEQKKVLEKSPKVKPKDIEKVITDDYSDNEVTTDDKTVAAPCISDSDDEVTISDKTVAVPCFSDDNEPAEPPPKREPDNLNDYVVENRDVLLAIFDTYLGITDSEDERAVIAGVKRFM